MSDRSGATFGESTFQTSDHASGASQHHAQQLYGGYHGELHAIAPGASEAANQMYAHDPAMNHLSYSAQQHEVAPGQFTGFDFSPAAPPGWDWTNSIDFAEFNHEYEPQGELIQEYQSQINTSNDFSIPLPVPIGESAYQAFQQHQSATPTPNATQARKPLSPPRAPPPPPPRLQQQRSSVQTGMKRKVDSEPSSTISQSGSGAAENSSKRQNQSRQSSDASPTPPVVAAPAESRSPPVTRAAAPPAPSESASQPGSREDTQAEQRKEQGRGTGPQGRVIDVSKPRRVQESPGALDILPAGKVFPIQIGSELFRLSGASLSSDAPSYFSHFFGQQLHDNDGRAGDVRTLYIDRDPDTFRDIALHLQGYHITPKDGEHFVKLFADAQFYSLPRLTKQLFSTDIFVRIGGTPFQIPRDLFSAPGDSPNYFTLGFAQFFSTPSEVFPGLDRNALLRPPSISPPSVPNRNGETFGELIQLLQGYSVEIRNDAHRSRLLRDARYFHLKGLEQKLVPCEVSYNIRRQQTEILIRLEDIRQSGISFSPDRVPSDSDNGSVSRAQSIGVSPGPLPTSKVSSPARSTASSSAVLRAGYVSYARPYTDDHPNSNILVLEISTTESTTLYLPYSAPKSGPVELNLRATFHNSTLARITSLFSVIASKMGLPATQPLGLMYLQSGAGVAAQPPSPANSGVSDRRVRIRIDTDCALEINGSPAQLSTDTESGRLGFRTKESWLWGGGNKLEPDSDSQPPLLRAAADDPDAEMETEWTVKRAHWRLRVEPDESSRRMLVVLCGVRIEIATAELARNRNRGFLGLR
ncbi:BTB/POZ domain-containing protein [Decorospora gaudefroyi]|uniref:BTB/POZ domain-containing protein n=1 Tax=Decorospora gaudefroyi TaxID=184978 RepID=A0A6A5KN61_9PLEO|nr:BTB/POZ domain-containing protein [Decorospora gaudefroyi]